MCRSPIPKDGLRRDFRTLRALSASYRVRAIARFWGSNGVFDYVSLDGQPLIGASVRTANGWAANVAVERSAVYAAIWHAVRWVSLTACAVLLGQYFSRPLDRTRDQPPDPRAIRCECARGRGTGQAPGRLAAGSGRRRATIGRCHGSVETQRNAASARARCGRSGHLGVQPASRHVHGLRPRPRVPRACAPGTNMTPEAMSFHSTS